MRVLSSAVLLVVLFSLFGCLTVSYDSKQKFMDDGTSSMTINEYTGLNKNMISRLGSLTKNYGGGDSSTALLQGMTDYYTSSAYSGFVCSALQSNPAVTQCTPNDDGSVTVNVNLSPGDFYTYNMTTDWVNLKEVRTYKISKIPMASYFALSQNPQYSSELTQNMNSYLQNNIGKYFTKDYYCSAGYTFNCDIESYSGTQAVVTLNTTSSLTPLYVNWVACSNSTSDELLFANSTDLPSMVYTQSDVGRVVSSTEPATVTLDCPADSQSIVVSYKSSDYTGNIVTQSTSFSIQTKQQMEDSVLQSLNQSTGMGSLGTYGTGLSNLSTNSSDSYIIDLGKGKMLGMDFNSISQLSGGLTGSMMDVTLNYEGDFPDSISSATLGGVSLTPSGNTLPLALSDFESDHGLLTVTTEKDISPLGVYTWLVLAFVVLVVLCGVAYMALMKPKKQ